MVDLQRDDTDKEPGPDKLGRDQLAPLNRLVNYFHPTRDNLDIFAERWICSYPTHGELPFPDGWEIKIDSYPNRFCIVTITRDTQTSQLIVSLKAAEFGTIRARSALDLTEAAAFLNELDGVLTRLEGGDSGSAAKEVLDEN